MSHDAATKESIIAQINAGSSYRAVAEALGVTRNVVAGILQRARQNGVKANAVRGDLWSDDEEARLRRMVASGADDKQMAHALGRTARSIRRRREKLKLHRVFLKTKDALSMQRIAAAQRQAEVYAKAAAEIPMPAVKSLWDAFDDVKGCRFIAGDPKEGHIAFCGRETKPGCAWCPDHRAVVYTRAEPARRAERLRMSNFMLRRVSTSELYTAPGA